MLGRDDRYASANRMRTAAPLLALSFPVLLLVVAGVLGVVPCEAGAGCARSTERIVSLLAIAAPTLPVAGLLLSALPDLVTVLVGVAASLPLWSGVGLAIARRVIDDRNAPISWGGFWRRYLAVCGIWFVVAVVLIGIYRGLSG